MASRATAVDARIETYRGRVTLVAEDLPNNFEGSRLSIK